MLTTAPPTETRWFTGARARILVNEETYSLLEMQAPAGDMPPLHVHADHDEIFYVLEGRVSLHLPGASVEAGPGEAAFGPRGVPHAYRVESDARFLVAATSGAFASFVEETSVPAESEGYAPLDRLPSPQELTEAAARRGIEILGPPGMLPA
jgi:quercetin dioxygenase-like cupin family protein